MGEPDRRLARRNRNTALILLSIALVFFFGVMAKYFGSR